MNAHVRDRLSAYLDQELAPVERTAVETHLHACDACRQHLETLGAVDAAARALPVEAPPGYFDALPGRVRARLEKSGARARRVPARLPTWTWAVAAALVLGVITPLTMMSVWRSRPVSVPAPRPADLPPPSVATSPLAEARGETEEMKRSRAGEGKLRPAAPGSGRAPTGVPAGGSIPAPGPAPDAFAPAPPAVPAEYAASEAPAAARPSTLGARKRAPAPEGQHEQQQGQTQAAAEEVSAGNRAAALRADEPAADKGESKGLRSEPQAPPRAQALAKTSGNKDVREVQEELVVQSDEARADSPEAEYRRLLAAPVQTVAALRARREAWRAFALRFPESPRADEARVRVVETGAAAWRLGHDPTDRARVREDAAAYLGGKDSAQAARVLEILHRVEEP